MAEPGGQMTLAARTKTLRGVGLHGGQPSSVALAPGAPSSGLVFRRIDRAAYGDIAARIENLRETPRATGLGYGPAEIRLVEHLMAATVLAGLDNALIEVEGDEVPAADGSAAPFLDLIMEAGLAVQDAPREVLVPPAPIEVVGGTGAGWAIRLEPAEETSYAFRFRGGGSLDGAEVTFAPGHDDPRPVAFSRTWCYEAEIQALLARGLGRGGNAGTVLVISSDGAAVNPMRVPLEPVRHKLLDLIGDLALAGRPIRARVKAEGTGHAVHAEFLKRALPGMIRKEVSRKS